MLIIAASGWAHLLNFILIVLSIFLMFIILIQRGKGGGLAGAFGAPGGSSAFGSRTGDAFMRFTIWVAAIWVLLLMIQVRVIKNDSADRQINSEIGRTAN